MLAPETIASNIRQVLAQNPAAYRNFGVYWWFVKEFLKRFYTRDNLYLLGDYRDEAVAAMIPAHASIEEALHDALATYGINCLSNHCAAEVAAPSGDLVTIYDDDARL